MENLAKMFLEYLFVWWSMGFIAMLILWGDWWVTPAWMRQFIMRDGMSTGERAKAYVLWYCGVWVVCFFMQMWCWVAWRKTITWWVWEIAAAKDRKERLEKEWDRLSHKLNAMLEQVAELAEVGEEEDVRVARAMTIGELERLSAEIDELDPYKVACKRRGR